MILWSVCYSIHHTPMVNMAQGTLFVFILFLVGFSFCIKSLNTRPQLCSNGICSYDLSKHPLQTHSSQSTRDRVIRSLTIQNQTEATQYKIVELGEIEQEMSSVNIQAASIAGLRIEGDNKGVIFDEEETPVIQAGTPVTVRFFGDGLSNISQFRFVLEARERGADCDDLPFIITVNILQDSVTSLSARLTFRLPSLDQISQALPDDDETPAFYICSLGVTNGQTRWVHQGNEPGVKLRTFRKMLPLWFQIVIIGVLLSLSGLFSGLNLGLMALDRTDLKIYENTGSDREKRFARAISPVRNHGNYLLCTLLLGNVLVNSSLTILLDDLTSGIIAIVGSTIGIVILGEIVPQAICSRYGLTVGAHTVWITKFFMLVTFPLAYPISLVLNLILGEEIGAYYNRERLKELIKVTNEYHDLEKEEMNIISGALEMRRKKVGDIMTRLEDIFMLSIDSVLDFETVSEIIKQGFSRVPVFDGERTNIVGLLFIKELALVDPEDAVPLKMLCRFYQSQCNFVFEDTTLDVVFKDFKEGHKGHMAFVQRVNNSREGDPFYETIGLVTLEDVIEELIQAEIVDETDVWSKCVWPEPQQVTECDWAKFQKIEPKFDNRSKRRREKSNLLQDFSSFAVQYRGQTIHKISPQLALSAFQFLSSTIDPFDSKWISENVLRRLVQQGPVIQFVRVKNRDKSDCDPDSDATLIYQQGKPADYFVLILEGRVEVTVGKESLVFESGPFSHFGSHSLNEFKNSIESGGSSRPFRAESPSARTLPISEGGRMSGDGGVLLSQTFISDYTVRAITDVTYLRVSRFLYQAARNATLLERAQSSIFDDTQLSGSTRYNFDQESNHRPPQNGQAYTEIIVERDDVVDRQGQDHCQQVIAVDGGRNHKNGFHHFNEGYVETGSEEGHVKLSEKNK